LASLTLAPALSAASDLPLHDALPIWPRDDPAHLRDLRRARAGRAANDTSAVPRTPAAARGARPQRHELADVGPVRRREVGPRRQDRKSTRLNSSHEWLSYAVFCLKRK